MQASLCLHSPWRECTLCRCSLPAGHVPAVITWWVNMVAQISDPANTRCCFAELISPVAAIYGSVILGQQRTCCLWTHFHMWIAMWINHLLDQWFWESSSVITTGTADPSQPSCGHDALLQHHRGKSRTLCIQQEGLEEYVKQTRKHKAQWYDYSLR